MRMKLLTKLLLIILSVMISSTAIADDGLVIIANRNISIEKISRAQVLQLYMTTDRYLANIGKLQVADQVGNQGIRAYFYQLLTGKKLSQIKGHWAKIMFTGNGSPPKKITGNHAALQWVAAQNNRIAYVRRSAVDSTVKILLVLK